MVSTAEQRPEALERRILELGSRFASAAENVIVEALSRRLAGFLLEERAWYTGLGSDRRSFDEAAQAAIRKGASDVADRLAAADLWTSPCVVLDERLHGSSTEVGAEWLPESVARWLRRRFRRRFQTRGMPEEDLDDPNNRVWIALLSAARPLNAVMAEFAAPGDEFGSRDAGGGTFGLQPRTAAALDPDGELTSLWSQYRRAHAEWWEARSANV